MFPISILRIEPGTVWGTDRIVTSKSGTYGFASIGADGEAVSQLHETAAGVAVFLYNKGFLVSNTTTAGPVARVKMMEGDVDVAVVVLQATATRPGKTDDLPAQPQAVLRSNPLKGLPALRKVHYSWPFPNQAGVCHNDGPHPGPGCARYLKDSSSESSVSNGLTTHTRFSSMVRSKQSTNKNTWCSRWILCANSSTWRVRQQNSQQARAFPDRLASNG